MSIVSPALKTSAIALCLGTALAPALAQVATHVDNTATLTFTGASGPQTISSNTVSLAVDRTKVPTRLSFRLLPIGYQLTGLKCETVPAVRFTPAPIDAATLAAAPPLASLDGTTPQIIVLENTGGNHDQTVRESIAITVTSGGRSTPLHLLETGPNTGVFAGGVPAASTSTDDPALAPCNPELGRGASIDLSFAEDDYSYGSTASILIDPAGYVFDSTSGALIDGATVTLLDDHDQPAKVLGDDGTSDYPSTVKSGDAVTDTSGRRYAFSQGKYRFPQVAPGTYHLKITPPGHYTAPSAKSAAELAALRDPAGKPFVLNAASTGGAFVLDAPDPFYADIPIDRATESLLLLTKTASVREASPGDFIQYRVTLSNRDSMTVSNIKLSDHLPSPVRYERGSARGVAEPDVSGDGKTLGFSVPSLAPNQSIDVTYVVSVKPGAETGEALNRVVGSGSNGATSNEAAASVRIRPLLFTDGFTIIGRITEGACGDPIDKRKGLPGIRLVLEDGTYVSSDRDGLYHFEGVRPGRHVVQLDAASVPVSYEAVACDADTRQAGSAISRFVESDGGLLKRVDFQLRPTGKKAEKADVLPITVASDGDAAGNRDWLSGQTPGVEMLFPAADHNPRAPTLRVVIKHLPTQKVALRINGELVDTLAFDTTDIDKARGLAISRWTGIPLNEGDNALEARVLDENSALVTTLTRIVHSASIANHAAFVPEKSRLVADGLTRPLIAVRVTDRDGKPVRDGTLVPFKVDQPYTAAIEAELEQARQLAAGGRAATTARVTGDEGLAFIALQPTTQAGAVHAIVSLTEEKVQRDSEIRAWLAGSAKQWMVVGFGAGTLGYDTLKTRSSALPRGERNHVVTDGQLAFYAKGRVKGSWLLTIAYDSDRKYDRNRGLLGQIDPDRYYTVYGDGSRQGYDAPTAKKLYVRLERKEFYALFGDYETGLTDTQLMRYSRTLNGAKVAYEGRHLLFNGFAAKTDQLYARDEIQGNGLSGPYRLSGRDIVPNSDQVRIEVRDRFRSELIVSTTQLTRHIDYDIDTSLGTLRFRNPVLTRDSNQNPTFIVVDYETYGVGEKIAAGGRVAARFAKGKVEVGASGLYDETANDAAMVGLDLKAKPTRTTEIRAEASTGGKAGLKQGQAFLAEVEHHSSGVDGLAYVRQQDYGFGVGQQNVVEAGTRKYGFDGRVVLTPKLTLTGSAWHQEQLDTNGVRTAAEARLEYRRANGTIFVGGQLAMDKGIDGKDRDSRLLTLGGSQAFFHDKLAISGQTQFAPGGDKDSVDFPIRHQIMASYRVKPGIRLLAGYEIADGKDYAANTAQVGFDVKPWTGAKLMSTLNQQAIGENGQRTYAQYGMSQSLPLGKAWTLDTSLDASSTVRGKIPTGAVINAFQPVASGGSLSQQGDSANGNYVAVTLGASYRAAKWSWNGRGEFRTGSDNDRWGFTSALLRSLGEGKTLASGIKYNRVTDKTGKVASFLDADLSLAFRPLDSRWSVLERLAFRNESADAGISAGNVLGVPSYGVASQETLRLVNNLALNYRSGPEGAGHGIEATVYYGAKWVRGSFGDDDYTGYIDVTGFDLRKDVGRKFDIGVQGSVQHAWGRGSSAFSGGPSAGVSPAPNVWISAGYNISGYRDRDFEQDRYTRKGPYVTMRLKFDQLGIGALGRRFGGGR